MNKRNTTKPKNEEAQRTEQETDQEAEKGEAQEAEAKKTGKSEETEAYKEGSRVDQLLRLYPKYKRAYVSKKGFVYPEGTPEWQRGDAVLYENKYFTK